MGKGPKEINKKSRKKARIQKLRKKDGSLTSNREEILKICSDFYQELYNFTDRDQEPRSKNNITGKLRITRDHIS